MVYEQYGFRDAESVRSQQQHVSYLFQLGQIHSRKARDFDVSSTQPVFCESVASEDPVEVLLSPKGLLSGSIASDPFDDLEEIQEILLFGRQQDVPSSQRPSNSSPNENSGGINDEHCISPQDINDRKPLGDNMEKPRLSSNHVDDLEKNLAGFSMSEIFSKKFLHYGVSSFYKPKETQVRKVPYGRIREYENVPEEIRIILRHPEIHGSCLGETHEGEEKDGAESTQYESTQYDDFSAITLPKEFEKTVF
jgi:hypothetical protein